MCLYLKEGEQFWGWMITITTTSPKKNKYTYLVDGWKQNHWSIGAFRLLSSSQVWKSNDFLVSFPTHFCTKTILETRSPVCGRDRAIQTKMASRSPASPNGCQVWGWQWSYASKRGSGFKILTILSIAALPSVLNLGPLANCKDSAWWTSSGPSPLVSCVMRVSSVENNLGLARPYRRWEQDMQPFWDHKLEAQSRTTWKNIAKSKEIHGLVEGGPSTPT